MISYFTGISRRWEMMFMLCSGVIVVYTLRVNISVAAPIMQDDLGWSDAEKGYVLSSFYWGYALGQIPASRFALMFGAKWLFGLSVLIPSLLTVLVPVACKSSFSAALVIRALIGFCESASFPAIYHFLPIWIPLSEKTSMITTVMSGMYIGEILGFSLSGYLGSSSLKLGDTDVGGWPCIFYVFGLLGIIWFPLWAAFAYESPTVHPYISPEEKKLLREGNSLSASLRESMKYSKQHDYSGEVVAVEEYSSPLVNDDDVEIYLQEEPGNVKVSKSETGRRMLSSVDSFLQPPDLSTRIPWIPILTHRASLTLFLAYWVFGFIGFMLLSEMPSFLIQQLEFNIESAGFLCIAPYMGLFIFTIGFGQIFDYLQIHHGWKTRTVRQVAQFIAFMGSGSMLLLCGFMEDRYVAYGFLILGQSFLGASQSGLGCSFLDVSPTFSSTMNTVGNTVGAIAGIAGPLIVATFTDMDSGVWGWRYVFILTQLMAVVSLFFWALFQTSDIVPILNTPLPE